jgi:hypothetical protein
LRKELPEVAARRLDGLLKSLDATEKRVFALRGMAALLIEERQLYRFVVDQEVGDYYQSFDKWLKDSCPESWSYVRQALRAVKELKEVPFEDLLQIRRCNLTQLAATSSSVRVLPEVIKAAKTLPEKELVETLNRDHSQHLTVNKPVLMAAAEEVDELEQAISMAMELEGCTSRQEAIHAIAVDYLTGHREAWEHRKEQTA